MRIAAAVVAVVALGAAGCLDPLVKDKPGASSHLLPPGTRIDQLPRAADNPALKIQIGLNDGLDDTAFAINALVPRGMGMSAGGPVQFWSFGPTTRAPSPIYEFFRTTESGLVRIDEHPALLDAIPGDPGYSPIHGINHVVVTEAYAGELITSMAALADAIDLGLVEDPVPIKMFVDSPVVLPNAKLEVGNGNSPIPPETMFAHGYTVTAFRFGGALGIQPTGTMVLPVNQVSFLREPGKIADVARPIFQATIPTMPPPPMVTTYTPLSVVVNVDLVPNSPAVNITRDSDLFMRSPMTGNIIGTTPAVAAFQITTSLLLLPLQFKDGQP